MAGKLYLNKSSITLITLLAGILFSFFCGGFAGGAPRYLLPFYTGILILWLYVVIKSIRIWPRLNQAFVSLSILVFLPIILSSSKLDNFLPGQTTNDSYAIKKLIQKIESDSVQFGYSSFWELSWQINFLRYDQIFIRDLYLPGRIPPKYLEIDKCLYNDSSNTVLIGRVWELDRVRSLIDPSFKIEIIENRYFIIDYPNVDLLQVFGFQLSNPLKASQMTLTH